MRPSRRLVNLLLAWLLLGLLTACATIFDWPPAFELRVLFWGFGAILLLLALLDWASLRRPQLRVERGLEPHLALGVRQRVTLVVVNEGEGRVRLALTDFAPPQIQIDGMPLSLAIDPGERAEVRYAIHPLRRGLAEWGRVGCRVISSWGLWEKNYYYGDPQQAKVYPNYKPLFRRSEELV